MHEFVAKRSPYLDIPELLDYWVAETELAIRHRPRGGLPVELAVGNLFRARLAVVDPLNQILVAAHAGARYEDAVASLGSMPAEALIARRLVAGWAHQVAPRLRRGGLAA